MNNDEIMMLAKKHHITDAYEYGSGVSDEDVIAFFNAALQTKQVELTDEEIKELQIQHTEKGHFADTLNVKDFARAILRKAQE
jgi:hypothetical protein